MERMSLGKSSGEKSENITTTLVVSVSGLHILPVVVSGHKRTRGGFLVGDPPNTITVCNDLRYIPSALFAKWIHHFQEKVRDGTKYPVLLLLYNHSAHISLEGINICWQQLHPILAIKFNN
jgi:hypothetical protein